MRLQLDRNLRQYNSQNGGQRVFVIHYDDFNGWIGQLQTRLGRGKSAKPERVLQQVGIHDPHGRSARSRCYRVGRSDLAD